MRLIRRLRYLVRRRREASELAEEMEFHRAMLETEHPENAARRMGNTLRAHEEARGVWLAGWVESFGQDLAYGARALARQPGFTATALLALVLGIGLNTSLFTIFNAFALRPWPVRDPGRLVSLLTIRGEEQHRSPDYAGFSVSEYRYLAAHTRTLSGLIVDWTERINLDSESDGAQSLCHFVSGNYFRTLGVDMALGRGFIDDEDRPGAPQAVAVLSYRTWKARYGGAQDMVGRRITVDDVPFTLVGVASEEFTGIAQTAYDLWVPLPALAAAHPGVPVFQRILTEPHYCCSDVSGRLAPGVTRDQATAE
ncbi:MAG TPA: ABC transporter permease, partial [Bryobacteraceae bacterium]|nr:ABC transporter permease [Bryobacteraceae bacterium]